MPSTWKGRWIGYAYDPREELGVFVFKRDFTLTSVPKQVKVKLTGDQRFRFYVNETLVCLGPQRGEVTNWFFHELDLAPYLKEGENHVHAVVWSFGRWSPMAQHSARTGFALDCPAVSELSTGGDWQAARFQVWDFAMRHRGEGHFYIDVGPGESVDFRFVPPGEDLLARAHALPLAWKSPNDISGAEERGVLTGSSPWMLVPADLPDQRHELWNGSPTRKHGFEGDLEAGDSWKGKQILLDFGELLTAYPQLRLKGAENQVVKITYSEALFAKDGTKGNRDEVKGKSAWGYQDSVILSGNVDQFEPLWWRTFRYVLFETEGPEPLEFESAKVYETGYPYEVKSHFQSSHPRTGELWDVSVRTAQRCAGETYFDCPYYEQLQYAGDTRIQALLGYYLSTDRRLQRQAIEAFRRSATHLGLTQSRYPSRQIQIIPPFSLWWILMLHDQLMYDRVPVDLTAVEPILDWWQSPDPEEPHWCFADWVDGWGWGVPPLGVKDGIHQQTVRLAQLAFRDLCKEAGRPWNRKVDTVETKLPIATEHERALKALADRWQFGKATLAELSPQAAKCTYYFQYYDHQARRPDDYFAEIVDWVEMLDRGLTTFAEKPEPVRSDCHAWSAHPVLGFFSLVAGITSSAPGWKETRIEPRPGPLTSFEARLDHFDGEMLVRWEHGKLRIKSPVKAHVVWKGKELTFPAGADEVLT